MKDVEAFAIAGLAFEAPNFGIRLGAKVEEMPTFLGYPYGYKKHERVYTFQDFQRTWYM